MYFAGVYNLLPLPNFATWRAEFYNRLRSDVLGFSKLGEVFVLGDFNARLSRVGDARPNLVATAGFDEFSRTWWF